VAGAPPGERAGSREPGAGSPRKKDFLSILDFDHGELDGLLSLAARMKAERALGPKAPTATSLSGMHVALLFEKPSLRTRSTFEVAIHELGADTLHLPAHFAEGVREPLEDVARNLERWVRALVIRTYGQEKAQRLATAGKRLTIVNALTDEQHPCQALADIMTMREKWGRTAGRTVAYVGDSNNVATSLMQAALMMGVNVRLASLAGYTLADEAVQQALARARDGARVERLSDPRAAARGADAVYTDVWASMGEEHEADHRRQVFAPYQVNSELMRVAAPHAIFMHCLPAHRGEEVAAEVIESSASIVFDQAENRLHTQKALLHLLLAP
jgi:ornithine carbamoyltransferase